MLSLLVCQPDNGERDSLKGLYLRQNGKQRLQSIIALADSYTSSSPDSVQKYARIALSKAKNQGLSKEQTEALLLIGQAFRMTQTYDSAEIIYQQAMEAAPDELLVANSYMGLGGIFYASFKFDKALESFISATTIFEKLNNEDRLAAGYSNIGLVLNASNNDEEALEYFRRSISISRKNEKVKTLLPALVNISTLFLKNDQYDSAIQYSQESYDISIRSNHKYGQAKSLSILCQSHIAVNQPQKGLEEATKARKLFEELGIIRSSLTVQQYEARALEMLGHHARAFDIAQNLESQKENLGGNDLEHLYLLLSELYESENDHELALHYYKLYQTEHENFISREKDQFINELETKYETAEKEQEITTLKQQNRIQELINSRKNLVIAFTVSVFILLTISIIFFYQKRLLVQNEQIAIHKQQLLRSQMNPHFIFNALTSIRGYLFDKNDLKEAVNYLGKFAKLMRMVLDHSSREWVSLEEELEALKIYLEIQKMRFNQGFSYEVTIDPDIPVKSIKVPPLLAQPFVENAIEHGFKNINYEGKVEFTCKSDGELIRFVIRDNGIGIDHVAERAEHESRALRIFKQRLDILSKRLKVNLSYLIKDLASQGKTGTLVEFALPTQSNV